jgi:MFS family permease
MLSQLIGPPVGGALFDRFGIRGPCLFGIIVIAIDLMCRLLLIERREALVGGFDPVASVSSSLDLRLSQKFTQSHGLSV